MKQTIRMINQSSFMDHNNPIGLSRNILFTTVDLYLTSNTFKN